MVNVDPDPDQKMNADPNPGKNVIKFFKNQLQLYYSIKIKVTQNIFC
jgi:hypothetical protein